MKQYLELAAHLFLLQVESVTNDPHGHSMVYDLTEKYGERAIEILQKELSDDHETIKDVLPGFAAEIKKDFDNNLWIGEVQYYSAMFGIYGGFIDSTLEKQLALLTGVGYQGELFEA